MKRENIPTADERLERIESDLATIKHLLGQLVSATGQEQQEPDETIFSVKQVAAFLGVEPTAIYTKCNKGELPFFKMGKLYRFKKAEVMKWTEKPLVPGNLNVEDYVNRYLQKNVLRG